VSLHVGHLGIVRLTGRHLEDLRRRCYDRDRHVCVWPGCGVWLRWLRGYSDSMHMAHIRGRGAGGSDTIDNVRSLCFHHHIEVEHGGGGGKVVPHRTR
jgi:hypothetical protein